MLVELYQSLMDNFVNTDKFKTVSVYNKQIQKLINGNGYSYNLPACFIEIIESNAYQIGCNLSASDLDILFHIAVDALDSADGYLDQNIYCFVLRNEVKKLFNLFRLPTGGCMQWINEDQDYDHDNVYHYVVRFRAHQIDTAALPETITYEGTASTIVLTATYSASV